MDDMLPGWVVKVLESGGLWGAITFVLLMTVGGLVTYIRTLHKKADKVYGYRLEERDTLSTTLSGTAAVLEKIVKTTDERNEITEELGELIAKQAAAFELLKVTVLAQYDNIKDHNQTSSLAVASMADAIRVLTSMLVENRSIANDHVTNVRKEMSDLKHEVAQAIRDSSTAELKELRRLLGNVTRIENRRGKPL